MPDLDPVQVVMAAAKDIVDLGGPWLTVEDATYLVAALDAAGLLATAEQQRLARIGQRAVEVCGRFLVDVDGDRVVTLLDRIIGEDA